MDLKCKKMVCKYNNGCACMSKKIKVTRNCECGTYEKAENIDNELPIINSFIHKDGYIVVEAVDNESGLDSEAYSFDNTVWTNSNKKKIDSNGKYTVYVRDKLGNVQNPNLMH